MPTDTSDQPTPAATSPGRAPGPVVDGDERAPDRRDGLPAWLIAGVAVAGVAVRLAILLSPLGRPDSDEVIAALMVRNMGDDGFPAFFWGQHYGGTIELAPVAASLRVFGWSVGAMRVPTLVLAVLNALLVWRIGRRWLPERQAQLAGLLVWIGPPAFVWFGVREQLFYAPTMTLGLVLGLAAFRIRSDGRARDYAVAGLALGLGIWTSTNIAYFVLPAVVVAAGGGRPVRGRFREVLVGLPVAAVAAFVGAWPFIEDYLETDGAPLRIAEKFPELGTYWSRFGSFFVEGLPGALGFRTILTHEWIAGAAGVAAYAAVLGLLLWSLWRSAPGRGRIVGWAAVGFVAYPFIYARIPFVTDDPNLRYTTFVIPFVALVLARVVPSVRAATVALVLTLLVTTVGLVRLHAISEGGDTGSRVGNVGDLVPVIDVLRREGIDAIYGDYWVAYRITFETEEDVIAATSSGVPRYDPYVDHVRGSDRSAWVVDGGGQLDNLVRALDGLDVEAEVIPAGDFAVVIPERHVGPLDVPEEARRPV